MKLKHFATGAALIAALACSFEASARPGGPHHGGGFHHGGGVHRPGGFHPHHPGVHPGHHPGFHPGFHGGYHHRPWGRPGWGYGGWRRPGYGWRPGGAIAAGAAIGFLTAAAAASAAPAPGLCWYYTNPARTAGFWDYCP